LAKEPKMEEKKKAEEYVNKKEEQNIYNYSFEEPS
jgi:hypothetical protein